MASDLITALEKIQDGASGNVGYFCKGKIEFGWKAFVSGVSEGSFFSFDPYNPKTVEAAKERATAFASEHGAKAPSKSISLTILRETIKGRTVTWQADMSKQVARWMPAYEKLWLPALEKLGITKPGEYWMHVALVNDPSGRTEKFKGNDGQERDVPSKVWIPDVIYPTEAACTAAAAAVSTEAQGSGEEVPAGYTAEMWAKFKLDVIKECGNGAPPILAKVSETWNIPVEFLTKLIGK